MHAPTSSASAREGSCHRGCAVAGAATPARSAHALTSKTSFQAIVHVEQTAYAWCVRGATRSMRFLRSRVGAPGTGLSCARRGPEISHFNGSTCHPRLGEAGRLWSRTMSSNHERSERLRRAAKDVEVRAKIAEGGLSAL